jgi:cyclopropane fatty-acyl-phospholipid synthase-like methyltransferase
VARRYGTAYRRVNEQLADWMTIRPGERVLDVGCFTGELLVLLADRGAAVYGVELQAEAVKLANERLGGRVVQTDIESSRRRSSP